MATEDSTSSHGSEEPLRSQGPASAQDPQGSRGKTLAASGPGSGAVLALKSTLRSHTARVWAVCWHPTAPEFASTGGDKTILTWARRGPSAAAGGPGDWARVAVIPAAHERTVRSVAYGGPSGAWLASGGFDGKTKIWGPPLGAGPPSPAGSAASGSSANEEYECLATLEGHDSEVKCVAWNPRAPLLATCSRDKSVWIWETDTDPKQPPDTEIGEFECSGVLTEHTGDVKFVKWNPAGDTLGSCSYDDTIRCWKEDDGEWICAAELKGHTSTVWSMDWWVSPLNVEYIVSVSDDETVRFWKANPEPVQRATSWTPQYDYTNVHTIPNAHSRTIYSASWSPFHGRLVTCGGDNRINVYEPDPASDFPDLPTKLVVSIDSAHAHFDINCVRWGVLESTQHLILSGGDDGVVRVWQFSP